MPVGLIAEVCHWAGLVPLVVYGWRRGHTLSTWLVCTAMAVSWVADTAAHVLPPFVVSAAFPVAQFGLVFMALAPRFTALSLIGLTSLAAWAVQQGAIDRPDATLTVAGGIGVLALPSGKLRPGLAVYFGLGAAAWFWYCQAPGLYPWLAYQGCRLVGLTLLTVAVWRERPPG